VQSAPTANTFTVNVANVIAGTYGYFPNQALGVVGTQYNEPNLSVFTGPVTSMSGIGDLPGGDLITTLGLWRADDAAGCQPDPSVALNANQTYCNDQVGSALVQAGTFIHETGHTLMLPHAGYYPSSSPGGVTTFGENCKPNHVSSMSYLFQIRGIPGGNVDYSGQTLPPLDESNLTEANGLGLDINTQQPSQYGTRWYAPLGFIDKILQNSVGGRIATRHCDGSPTAPGEQMVRMTGTTAVNGQVAPLDWNNNGVFTDVIHNQDINFNGATNTNMLGFNDWAVVDLRHTGARRNVGGFSTDVGSNDVLGPGTSIFGGGTSIFGGGDDLIGGGADVFSDNTGTSIFGGGTSIFGGGTSIFGGGTSIFGGGDELTFEQANSTVDEPLNLTAALAQKGVTLSWTAPGFGRIRTYYIWRTDVTKSPLSLSNPPVNVGKVTGAPPLTTFTDTSAKTNATYQYFVTAALGGDSGPNSGNQSGPSNTVTIFVK
jgi:hypothetical protein